MDPHSPNKLIATKYCFLILGDDTRFFFFIQFIYFSFLSDFLKHKQANINFKKSFLIKPLSDFMLFYVILLLLIFTKIILLLLLCLSSFFSFFFMKIIVIFSCSGTVPECSVFLVLSIPGGKSVARLLNRLIQLDVLDMKCKLFI